MEPSYYGLMAEICYCGKLCEFATAANPDPYQGYIFASKRKKQRYFITFLILSI
jgi:hypothetical protein